MAWADKKFLLDTLLLNWQPSSYSLASYLDHRENNTRCAIFLAHFLAENFRAG